MSGGGHKTQILESIHSMLSSPIEDNASLLINSAKILSELEGVRVVIGCLVSNNDLNPVGVFGREDVRVEYFTSCEGVKGARDGIKLLDCSACRLCGDVDSSIILPLFFEGRNYALLALFGEIGKVYEPDQKFIECFGRVLSSLMYAMDMKEEIEQLKEVINENLSHFEYITDKIRNPLAAIVGYLEIKEDVGHEKAFEGIKLQAEKIAKVMEVLKRQEKITYGLKKRFEEVL